MVDSGKPVAIRSVTLPQIAAVTNKVTVTVTVGQTLILTGDTVMALRADVLAGRVCRLTTRTVITNLTQPYNKMERQVSVSVTG